jgi:hypothetical protein
MSSFVFTPKYLLTIPNLTTKQTKLNLGLKIGLKFSALLSMHLCSFLQESEPYMSRTLLCRYVRRECISTFSRVHTLCILSSQPFSLLFLSLSLSSAGAYTKYRYNPKKRLRYAPSVKVCSHQTRLRARSPYACEYLLYTYGGTLVLLLFEIRICARLCH